MSIGLTWAAISLLFVTYGIRIDKTISKHAAATKRAYIFMALIQTVILPTYALFIWKWYAVHLGLPSIFITLNIMSAALLLIAAWVPDTHSNKGMATVHGWCAYPAYVLFLPMFIIGAANTITDVDFYLSFS